MRRPSRSQAFVRGTRAGTWRRVAAVALPALVAATAWLSLSDDLPGFLTQAVQGHQLPAHAAMHGMLALTALSALGRTCRFAVLGLVGFAVLMEAGQGVTGTRQAGAADLAANLVGVLVGVLLARVGGVRRSRQGARGG